jgi:hypothetical protein
VGGRSPLSALGDTVFREAGDKFQAAWVAARFRGQFQEPAEVNVGQKTLLFYCLFPILEIVLIFSFFTFIFLFNNFPTNSKPMAHNSLYPPKLALNDHPTYKLYR